MGLVNRNHHRNVITSLIVDILAHVFFLTTYGRQNVKKEIIILIYIPQMLFCFRIYSPTSHAVCKTGILSASVRVDVLSALYQGYLP